MSKSGTGNVPSGDGKIYPELKFEEIDYDDNDQKVPKQTKTSTSIRSPTSLPTKHNNNRAPSTGQLLSNPTLPPQKQNQRTSSSSFPGGRSAEYTVGASSQTIANPPSLELPRKEEDTKQENTCDATFAISNGANLFLIGNRSLGYNLNGFDLRHPTLTSK